MGAYIGGVEVWEEDDKILGEGFLHILFYI